ncbi:MAG: type VI secretion system protein TssA [Steroidobacteraceae bacterium]
MTVSELSSLNAPITADRPCGGDLEDGPILGRFNGFRVFGRSMDWELPETAPEWSEIRTQSLATLAESKDLRILAHLAASVLRTEGLEPFCACVVAAADWLEQYWDGVYPGLDEDGIFRRNALSCLADRVAIIDALRRTPLVRSRQFGTFALRDLEIAQGAIPAPPDTTAPQETQIAAAFDANPLEELNATEAAATAALAALKRIEQQIVASVGSEATPDLQPLGTTLGRIDKYLRERQAVHPGAASAAQGAAGQEQGSGAGVGAGASLGVVRSRQDAIRALDAVARFFSETEPSSPVPMFIERAKRLVAKNFFEVLEDIAPDALTEARKAGGVRE